MTDYDSIDDFSAESAIFNRLTIYAAQDHTRYAEVGLMADTVDSKLLWRFRVDPEDGLPCRSFARWAHICPYPYSTLYAAMRDVRELIGVEGKGVDPEDVAEISQGNIATMKSLSTAVRRDPKVLQAAKTMRPEKFVEEVQKSHPNQALETRKPMKFNFTASQSAIVQGAIDIAIRTGYAASREELLESWSVNWMQEQGEAVADKEMVQ